ncbi:MAG: hypothetical protein HY840_05990 [Bacteroidetes bacterium]|nr:hypothetical protein [Bacteroidota bacterium]
MKRVFFVFLISLSCGFNVHASNDTLIVIFKKFKSVNSIKINSGLLILRNDTVFLINSFANDNEKLNEKALEKLVNYPYCKIYDKKHRLIEEGIWTTECFSGKYKSYHNNAVKKSEGMYHCNIKIGNWKYYDKKGKLVKEESYNEDGVLINTM